MRLVSVTLNYGNRSTNLFLTGENLAKAFVEVLESYDILHTLFTITSDNASNMVKMAKKIGQKFPLLLRCTESHVLGTSSI